MLLAQLNHLARVRTAVVLRGRAPQLDSAGNVRALAIRDLVADRPLHWHELPRVTIDARYLDHCLRPGEVVIPSRGDYYRAWLFEGADEPIFPLGQLNVITPAAELDARYLAWYLNQSSTQSRIALMLTGSSIKALTKAALLGLDVKLPPIPVQQQIAELDLTTQQIVAVRHRLNELDQLETAWLTKRILETGEVHA